MGDGAGVPGESGVGVRASLYHRSSKGGPRRDATGTACDRGARSLRRLRGGPSASFRKLGRIRRYLLGGSGQRSLTD